jgi:uncharacterized protein (TIGR00106 family)
MIVLEFSIAPLGKEESLSPYVARCLNIVDTSGLEYRCGAVGTTIEGDLDQVLDVVHRCFEAVAEDCDRIDCTIHMDYRAGVRDRLASSVHHVEEQLGRAVAQ